jgi:hypothetical protein
MHRPEDYMAVIVCFIDGIGLTTPAKSPWTTAHIPALTRLLGRTPSADLVCATPTLTFKAIDATLGVAGRPQSGTGHTTLWTGINAAQRLGRHFPAYPAPSQRPLIAEHNIFRRLISRGLQVVIATAHRPQYWELVAQRQQHPTAVALAAQSANVLLPSTTEYYGGTAIAWDITGEYLQRWGADTPTISPHEAAQRLVSLAHTADLVHYECYLPDFVGHGRIEEQADVVFTLLDTFLGSLLSQMNPTDHLLIVSDHGNLEEPEHHQHTFNPVPLIVVGPRAYRAQNPAITDLSHIAGLLENLLL